MAAALSFAGLPGMIQKYIKMRCVMTEYKMVLPVLAAFIVSVVLGPIIIPYLRKLKMGQTERENGVQSHLKKAGTPTMGGLMFIIGSAAAVLLLGWPDFAAGRFGGGFVLLFALVFGVIGYIDDYVKVK